VLFICIGLQYHTQDYMSNQRRVDASDSPAPLGHRVFSLANPQDFPRCTRIVLECYRVARSDFLVDPGGSLGSTRF